MAFEPQSASLGEQLRHERLLDMEQRLGRYRRIAFVILAAALIACGPFIGWWWLVPLTLALLAFPLADRFMVTSRHPERWTAAAWAISPLVVGISVPTTGGLESPLTMLFAIPAVTLGARFERRGVGVGLAYILALLVAGTVIPDPATVVDTPQFLILPVALVLCVTVLSHAVVESDRDHRRVAVIDPLTGLLNRMALDQRVAELVQQAEQSGGGQTIGFLACDLDHFKAVNDEHGHGVGDAVLRDVAYTLHASLRSLDSVYRIGGEEFLVVLPAVDLTRAIEIGERLRAAVAETRPGGIEVRMSVGAAAAPAAGLDFDGLYTSADGALYTAKQNGRDRVCAAMDPASAPPGTFN